MLNGASYRELQGFCHHIGVKAAGTQAELLARAIDHVKSTTDSPASPEGRDGRARSPRAGKAASALRKAAPKAKAQSPTVAEFIGDTPSLPKSSAPLPAVQPMPGFAATVDEAHAGHNPLISGAKAARMPGFSAAVDPLTKDDPWGKAAGMPVDESSSDVSEAPAVDDEVSLKDLMQKLNTIEKRQKHDKKSLRAEFRAELSDVTAPIIKSVEELTLGQVLIHDRIGAIENTTGTDVSEDFKRMFRINEKNDVAHTRIEFKKFTVEDKGVGRVQKIESVLTEFLGEISADHYGHLPKGPRGNRKLGNSYVQFSNTMDRDTVLEKMEKAKDKIKILNSKGEEVKFERAKTSIQKTRNWHMFEAYDQIKKKFGESDVNLKTKMPIRSVEYKGEMVFEQREFALIGRFMGPCAGMIFDNQKQ